MRIVLTVISFLTFLIATAQECVEISGETDTIIDARVVLNLAADEYLYGEKGGKNDEFFKTHQVIPNKDINGIKIYKEDGKVLIHISSVDFNGSKTITLKKARHNSDGWYPDENSRLSLTIVKQQLKENATNKKEKTDSIDDKSTPMNLETNTLSHKDSLWKTVLPYFIILVIAICICYILDKKLIAKAKRQILDDVIMRIDKSERKTQSQIQTHIQSKTIIQPREGINYDTINEIVDTKIKHALSRFSNSSVYSEKTESKHYCVESRKNSPIIQESTLNTDNVIYDMDRNTFRIGETDIKIFQIYSQGGEYFYNIIGNPNIREEFVSMIASYANCISIIDQGNLNAKSVEPVKAGKLIRNGNSFIVDQNNKLELRLI